MWQYEYTLKDHLGNTRVTFADVNNNNTIDPNTEINQINHYYPFGLNMEGNWNGASPDAKNKFQYNEKELVTDFDLNWNDYGARNYDATTGRFTTIDPLAEIFSFQSSYAYAANNPIKFIDFMGMGPTGADGMTNEQWIAATNPANNGSQAASTVYNGLRNAEATYSKKKAESEYAAAHNGATRAVEEDDIEASGSGSNIVWEGFRSGAFNTVTGFHFECGCGGAGEPPCNALNPSTLGKNLFGMTYPGGNNPMKFNGLADYSYNPGYKNLFEYPAIGHDRAYDLLQIRGASGLFISPTAIKADWRFVKEEFQIAAHSAKMATIFPYQYGNPVTTTFKSFFLGVGLGILATPKTIIFALNPSLAPFINALGAYSTSNSNNIPSK